jgi:protoporphyrinogen/coproporphyrinogen III oxidase
MAQFAATFSPGTSLHHSLPGGATRLVQALTASIKDRLHTSSPVTAIGQRDGAAEVQWQEGGKVRQARTRHVIMATPASVTREIAKDLPGSVGDALSAIRYGPCVVAALLTTERSAMPWDDIYAMVTPRRAFNMFFNTASILRGPGPRRPGGALMVYGASELARQLAVHPDGQVVDTFLKDLATIFPQLPGLVTEIEVQRWPEGIPYSVPGRHRWQHILDQPAGCVRLAGDYLGATRRDGHRRCLRPPSRLPSQRGT